MNLKAKMKNLPLANKIKFNRHTLMGIMVVAAIVGTYFVYHSFASGSDIVNVAFGQVGVKEGANNCNPYGPCGQPWCAYFITWVYQHAGYSQINTGYVPTMRQQLKNVGWYRGHNGVPQPGDIVMFGDTHAGLAVSVSGSTVHTIEGNIGPDGAGYVGKLDRDISSITDWGGPGGGSVAPPPSPLTWFLKNSNGGDSGNFRMSYGQQGDRPVPCDWDGNGSASAAVYRNGVFYITNHNNSSGGAEYTVRFGGAPGDIPVCGDWDGNGTQTVGIYRGGSFLLSNCVCQNSNAPTNINMAFGAGGDRPVVGRWIRGNHTDLPGVQRGNTFYQRYSWTNGPVQSQFSFGNGGDRGIAGDWDGDGVATIGVARGNTFYLSNDNHSTAGAFSFGNNSDTPITGSWAGGRYTLVGMVR